MDIREYYWTQKHHAKDRGIDWQFTFDTWRDWWGDDIAKRGSKKGCLVMARHNDIGPYHPDNVRKATVEENISEGQIGNANAAKLIKTPKGIFNSRIEAAKAYGVNVCTIRKRLNKYPADYHYLQD
jgi:hypothetical protein